MAWRAIQNGKLSDIRRGEEDRRFCVKENHCFYRHIHDIKRLINTIVVPKSSSITFLINSFLVSHFFCLIYDVKFRSIALKNSASAQPNFMLKLWTQKHLLALPKWRKLTQITCTSTRALPMCTSFSQLTGQFFTRLSTLVRSPSQSAMYEFWTSST